MIYKLNGFILTVGLTLGGGTMVCGQMVFPGGPAAQLPPEMAEMQKVQERLNKKEMPEFYAFQEKLRGIETRMGKISASLASKEIDKETAKEQMLPLIKEEQEIQNDPEFLVEQKLAQGYLSSPEYGVKLDKEIRAAAEKKKHESASVGGMKAFQNNDKSK